MSRRKRIIPIISSPDIGDCSLDIMDAEGNVIETKMYSGLDAYTKAISELNKHPHGIIYEYKGWEKTEEK